MRKKPTFFPETALAVLEKPKNVRWTWEATERLFELALVQKWGWPAIAKALGIHSADAARLRFEHVTTLRWVGEGAWYRPKVRTWRGGAVWLGIEITYLEQALLLKYREGFGWISDLGVCEYVARVFQRTPEEVLTFAEKRGFTGKCDASVKFRNEVRKALKK